ncbi:NAD(P)H-quinone oxidoreductase subunit L [Synechococcus sp. CS-1324]|uniref:NAD(P)H-quinone oxidoreductase subunit L n=1 Tax=unclassified Synechococcus TaxID=2626047 RepID=UPI000DB52DCA|nr:MULTISPECIES: NAD(P)H-quinone oxidoreductase subunit L [unclassified Synechococcus]MCT0214300.1 NAD(P)H-quinone oxidoreductase subunit L [Synechococcus sp. CS-1326]MCT0230137.1 NAD(P)H-quinone oxidoreductase subunit L [Synechococcus sp. CS-1324]MCT0234464.1 NAD(P)H-quinone oxidoreductase subunit L [Synechococcus sp. CS-1327]PZV05238.1 MAG: NADPH-quinone oxidoreductase [Cyanobium sp.]
MPLPGLLSSLSPETLGVLIAYVVVAGAYLVVVPLALYWWMNKRWTVMGKLERLGVYGLVFLFFPGLILFSPFLNLRLAGQGEA